MKNIILIKKLLFLILIVNSSFSIVYSQSSEIKRTNHWFFGQKAGLDFTTGTAVADTNGQMTVLEGNATMSDTSGNLLFYTDGKTVWNAQHDTMMNGIINGVGLFATPRQGALIIPLPGTQNIYYIFTVDGWEHQYQNGLRYHIIDMNLDNGKGAVTQKNITLFTPSTEQLAGIKDATGCGYWIVSHERYTDKFRAYHITSAGVDTNAIISAIGADYGYMANLNYYAGGAQLKFSPNGKFIASSNFWAFFNGTQIPDTLELYQFNSTSGILYNKNVIPADTNLHAYTFSPNSNFIFIESGYYIDPIYRYQINPFNQISISNSKTFIYNPLNHLQTNGDFQNTNDSNLILGCNELQYSINKLMNPNQSPFYLPQSLTLNGREALGGFPNFIQNFFDDSSANCIISVKEITTDTNILLFNPVTNRIVVRDVKFDQILMFDISGRVVYESSFPNNSPFYYIDVSSFSRGLYLISIYSNSKSTTQKIILN